VIIVNNTNVHAGTVRAGTSQRVDFRVDYGQKGLTQTEPAERVGDMSAEESGDAAISWNYQKIPTRIAAAHPELVDTLPNPELQARDGGRTKIKAVGGGGGVNSDAVRGVQRPGTCTPPPLAPVGAAGTSKPKIAAVVTVYREGSHSDVLLGKFLPGRGIPLDDGFHELRVDLVAIYIGERHVLSTLLSRRRSEPRTAADVCAALAVSLIRRVSLQIRSAAKAPTSAWHWRSSTACRSTRRSGRRSAAAASS
jgi:hypothetical protein